MAGTERGTAATGEETEEGECLLGCVIVRSWELLCCHHQVPGQVQVQVPGQIQGEKGQVQEWRQAQRAGEERGQGQEGPERLQRQQVSSENIDTLSLTSTSLQEASP